MGAAARAVATLAVARWRGAPGGTCRSLCVTSRRARDRATGPRRCSNEPFPACRSSAGCRDSGDGPFARAIRPYGSVVAFPAGRRSDDARAPPIGFAAAPDAASTIRRRAVTSLRRDARARRWARAPRSNPGSGLRKADRCVGTTALHGCSRRARRSVRERTASPTCRNRATAQRAATPCHAAISRAAGQSSRATRSGR